MERETILGQNQSSLPEVSKLMADLVRLQRQIAIVFSGSNGDSSILLTSDNQDFLDELHAQKDFYIKGLLEARARGEVSLAAYLFKFPNEQLHPWSRNNFDLMLPHPISVSTEATYSVRSNLHGTASSLDGDSQNVLRLLEKGNPPLEYADETADNFVVRRFYEIEEITALTTAKRKEHLFKEATQLQDLSTELAIELLRLRDNKRNRLDPQTIIPIRVGLIRDRRNLPAIEIQLTFEYSYSRGERNHSIFIPIPAQQKIKYKQTLKRLVIPYDFIEAGRT